MVLVDWGLALAGLEAGPEAEAGKVLEGRARAAAGLGTAQ